MYSMILKGEKARAGRCKDEERFWACKVPLVIEDGKETNTAREIVSNKTCMYCGKVKMTNWSLFETSCQASR